MKRIGLLLAIVAAVALLVSTVDSQPRYDEGGVRATMVEWRPEVFPPARRADITVDTSGLYHNWYFHRAPTFLALTTTPAGDNEILHPGAVYTEGFGGHAWWMVGSPFPDADPTGGENPEIFYSDNGNDWTAIKSNPITADPSDPAPAGLQYHSDPTLFYEDGVLHCFYRWSDASTEDRLKHKSSVDGETWSSETTVITGADHTTLVSPSIVNFRGTYYMWTVNSSGTNKLTYYTSASLTTGWGTATDCTVNGKQGTDVPWHVSVARVDNVFVLTGTFTATYDAYVGTSVDGVTFDCERIYETAGAVGIAWDRNFTYQLSAVWNPMTGSADVFYGGRESVGSTYHIGRGKLIPARDYDLPPLLEMLSIMGDCRGFWPFVDPSCSPLGSGNDCDVDDFSLGSHDLTASEDIGLFDTAPVFRNPVHVISFNGTDEEFDTPDHADFTFGDGGDDSPFTVSAWVYITDTAARRTIIAKSDEDIDVELREWVFEIDASDKLVLRLHDESANAYMDTVSNTAPSAAAWHLVTGTYTGSAEAVTELNLYVDGLLVASTDHDDQGGTYDAMEDLATKPTVGFMLGVDGTPTPSYFFNGKMAMPSVSAEERSAANEWLFYLNGKEILGL